MTHESLSVKRMKRIFWNETGQMTVFVALIFQVLFVFFAMVINIGLLVHDKINLQNAVDFGAYYGAQRQAEILNEIAHINYQIHQDNKLLAWRYWVLGTLGRDGTELPPVRSPVTSTFGPTDQMTEVPTTCVANFYWQEFSAKDSDPKGNYCYREFGASGQIPKIPELTIVAPFVPGVVSGALTILGLRNNQDVGLSDSGPLNWAFNAQMIEAYKMALTSRKAVIQKLRANLVAANFVDQTAQPVSNGVLVTIKKNLTVSNLASFQDDAFAFKNGLASANCAGPNGDGDPTIKEIRTYPTLLYTQPVKVGESYQILPRYETQYAHDLSAADLDPYDPQGFLRFFAGGEPSDSIGNDTSTGLNASSLGFEKNPWCMAYVSVHAKTSPRKPFAPFGSAVTLEARAFAQPFGGRIGPWYKSQWAQSAATSSGTRVDPRSTPRFINGANEDGGTDPMQQVPNYSRFPGDPLGLRAKAAQASVRSLVQAYGAGTKKLSYKYYVGYENIPATGDPLAWDSTSPSSTDVVGNVSDIRQAEIIAVAPDLFDATYYSIDSEYSNNYKFLNANGTRFGNLGSMFGTAITVPPDIGGRNGASAALENFSVGQQVATANRSGPTGLDPTLVSSGALGYFISLYSHLLTGWAPNTVVDFGFPVARFAKCTHAADPHHMIPGGCTNGGRTGYSVRLISRDHLLSAKWNIGGEGQVGPIRNPPALDF